MKLKLNIYPNETFEQRYKYREKLEEETKQFLDKLILTKKNKSPKLLRILEAIEDFNVGLIVKEMDGPNNYTFTKYEQNENEEYRNWISENFKDDEIQTIFDICLNACLLEVPDANQYYNGNSTLYYSLGRRKDSPFAKNIPKLFLKKIMTGAFWEDLADCDINLGDNSSGQEIDSILTTYFDRLIINQSKKGLELFKHNNSFRNRVTLDELSDKSIDNYLILMTKIYDNRKNLNILPHEMNSLILSYLEVISSPTQHGYTARFSEHHEKPHFKRIEEPLIQEYLIKNDTVRMQFASILYQDTMLSDIGWKIAYSIINSDNKGAKYLNKDFMKLANAKELAKSNVLNKANRASKQKITLTQNKEERKYNK